MLVPDRLMLILTCALCSDHSTLHGPGGHCAGADRESPMVIWTRTSMNVRAGTVKLPSGAETPSDDFPDSAQKDRLEPGSAL